MPASVEYMLGYCLSQEEKSFTEWEWEFLNDLADTESDHDLNSTQVAKLKEIYDAH